MVAIFSYTIIFICEIHSITDEAYSNERLFENTFVMYSVQMSSFLFRSIRENYSKD